MATNPICARGSMAIVLMAMSSFDIEFPWNFNEPYLAYLKLLLNSFFC